MIKLQQFTFVCAPHPAQWAACEAWGYDVSDRVTSYHQKRDLLRAELQEDFELQGAAGAFYMFPRAPWGTGTQFVKKAIENNLLIIPGNVFSSEDTHFRISYAAADDTLRRGAKILRGLAKHRR
jgi:aspartate aminotransferase/aminotransferase